MKSFTGVLAVSFLSSLGCGTALATGYVPGVPMASVVTADVRDCGTGGDWHVPLITWGADEVTVNANGGGLRTSGSSIFAKAGIRATLNREDDFEAQVKSYLSCKSPFLRATLGMAAQAADLTEGDPRTHMVAVYQHSWSAGGDVMVVRGSIHKIHDLKGKTVVVQRFGPHVDYLLKLLADDGLSPSDVKIKFVKDLTGKGANTPMAALQSDSTVDAAMVIDPDAATLTSGAAGSGAKTTGTGAEGSVKGAYKLVSTKSANHIITDIYFVRQDFYDANKDKLTAFTKAMLESDSQMRDMARNQGPDWTAQMKADAKILLDDASDLDDAKGLWDDADTTGRQGNARFFADFNYPRSFNNVSREVQANLRAAGLIAGTYRLSAADWDWQAVTGVADASAAAAPHFDTDATTQAVTEMHAQGKIDSDTLFDFQIRFKPNQRDFTTSLYGKQFDKVVQLASTYSGAVITVEGHADPLGYLNKMSQQEKAGGADEVILGRMVQSAKNLSISRAQQVRDAIIAAAKAKGIVMDPSQFVTVGLGYDDPATGVCGDRPCAPKNEAEWLSNMRVVFRIVNVEAESSAFVPAN